MDNRPIGIFDSGMGGLTVRAEIARALPAESLIYFGDGVNVPYGPRQKEEIVRFVDEAVGLMIEDNDVKIMIIACNAATGAAIEHLRAKYSIPIIGMEPAVKLAAQSTHTGIVGVLATAAAFKGDLYRTTSAQFRRGPEARPGTVQIIETVGEGFVELVENDHEETPEAYETVRRAVEPMLSAGADRIVLGCTHYPFLAAQIQKVVDKLNAAKRHKNGSGIANSCETMTNSEVKIVDSAPAIARRVENILKEYDLHADPHNTTQHRFLSFAGDDYIEHLERKSAKSVRL